MRLRWRATTLPSRAQAQWWSSRTPIDYEDCIEKGEKTADGKDAKAALTAQCDAKFAGRRKPGGGYTYFDFMQNRSFDIAGPNPTAEELRKMDEQYTEFLDQRRKTIIAAAFAAKQQQIAALPQIPRRPTSARPTSRAWLWINHALPLPSRASRPTGRKRTASSAGCRRPDMSATTIRCPAAGAISPAASQRGEDVAVRPGPEEEAAALNGDPHSV